MTHIGKFSEKVGNVINIKERKWPIAYLNIPSAICPALHIDEFPISNPPPDDQLISDVRGLTTSQDVEYYEQN